MLGWGSADGVDWSRLFDAYGVATQTPVHLRALIGDDREAQSAALDHLAGAVLHQGTVYAVTPVVVRVVAGLLGEPALQRSDAEGHSLLSEVIAFLGWAAEAAAVTVLDGTEPAPHAHEVESFYQRLRVEDERVWGTAVVGVLMRRAVLDLRGSVPELIDVVSRFVDDPRAEVRIETVGALTRMGGLAPAGLIERVSDTLGTRLAVVTDRDEKANLVMALGRLGTDTSPWLQDGDPAVRACAALSARAERRSTTILIEALTEPKDVDRWFAVGLPLADRGVRFCLLQEALARDLPFVTLLPAALAIIAVANRHTVSQDLEPLLQAAFPGVACTPGVRPPAPTALDDAQRALLRALVANTSLWGPTNEDARLARMRVGLPDERQAVAKLAR